MSNRQEALKFSFHASKSSDLTIQFSKHHKVWISSIEHLWEKEFLIARNAYVYRGAHPREASVFRITSSHPFFWIRKIFITPLQGGTLVKNFTIFCKILLGKSKIFFPFRNIPNFPWMVSGHLCICLYSTNLSELFAATGHTTKECDINGILCAFKIISIKSRRISIGYKYQRSWTNVLTYRWQHSQTANIKVSAQNP